MDLAAGYGGEGFVVILVGTDAAGALYAAERVRAAVSVAKRSGRDRVRSFSSDQLEFALGRAPDREPAGTAYAPKRTGHDDAVTPASNEIAGGDRESPREEQAQE